MKTRGATWSWPREAQAGARVLSEVADEGFSLFSVAPPELSADRALDRPWEVAQRLVGQEPCLVEMQPIAPRPGPAGGSPQHGRTIASSTGDCPLHTDPQCDRGAIASLQIMMCQRAARVGGESVLVDAWSLCHQILKQAPELFEELVSCVRRHQFYLGAVDRPTLGFDARGHLSFVHAPKSHEDVVGHQLRLALDRAPRHTLRVETGDVLVVDNLRMLHGRLPFVDPLRRFVRLLVWLEQPASRDLQLEAAVRGRVGEPAQTSVLPTLALRATLALLRGAPPAALALRLGVRESQLYCWRDRALAGALQALDESDDARSST